MAKLVKISNVFSFEKLYKAYLDCRKTKRKTTNALEFEWFLEKNLFDLEQELQTKTYKPQRSICFIVKDPCYREIFAAGFRDRVVHHLLIREIIEMGEKRFIFDSFACRKNKGTHLAIKRLKGCFKKATENFEKTAFYLQLDISGFFMSIDHDILYSIFRKMILKQNKSYSWKEDILWLAKTIIFHKPTDNYIIKGDLSLFNCIPPQKSLFHSAEGKGLPIGNYSSQFFANLYLNELDQFIKRNLNCKYYVRYVDDFILINQNKGELKYMREKIILFLREKLELRLNENKTKLQQLEKGIDFLGYIIKESYVLVRQRVVKRLKDKLYRLNIQKFEENKVNEIFSMVNSYYGHFSHAFSFNLRKDINDNHLGKLKQIFLPKKDYVHFEIKKEIGNLVW
jgi:RNA-directed DNA polymerase